MSNPSRDQLKQNLLSSSEGKGTLSKHRQSLCKSKEGVFGARMMFSRRLFSTWVPPNVVKAVVGAKFKTFYFHAQCFPF